MTQTAQATVFEPKDKRVLVVRKTSYYEKVHQQHDRHTLELLRAGDPSVARIETAYREHKLAVEAVAGALMARGFRIKCITRESLAVSLTEQQWDFVVTVGGDGTLLDTSHSILDGTPVVGVNSAPDSSHGKYCIATADTFPDVLDAIIDGKLEPQKLMRLRVTLDGEELPVPVLNEVLVAHKEIGQTSRYIVTVGANTEEQRSDGFFVGTPAGCSGWMNSYDGHILPINLRSTLFVVRGLIRRPQTCYRFTRGIASPDSPVRIRSLMNDAMLLVDGSHIRYELELGSELVIEQHPQDLVLYIDPCTNSKYMARPVRNESAP